MSGTAFSSAIEEFSIGNSPIEGTALVTIPNRGPYSSKIGLFVIGRSPVGLIFTPIPPEGRRVVFSLPEYPDEFDMPEFEDEFALPIPEGWAS